MYGVSDNRSGSDLPSARRHGGAVGGGAASGSAGCASIVPPYLLTHLAEQGDSPAARCARATLQDRERTHPSRTGGVRPGEPRPDRSGPDAGSATPPGVPTVAPSGAPGAPPGPAADSGSGPNRTIYDAEQSTTLPGTVVRREGEPATGDVAVTEAYDGLGATWQLFKDAYGRDSLDGAGLPLLATVHYGQDYDNAFWNGDRMVFGDGDGEVFNRFTIAVDVIGHELTHGVINYTANLTYSGQSGALNESIADVFGSLVRQQQAGQSAEQADWLIGAGLFTPTVKGVALRSMKAPGTAYDDPQLGKDPQPATMDGYVETTDDDGGVHLNSGIPNHAFYLAAVGIGGNAWEGAGQVWYDVLTGPQLTADCDFATFAALTTDAARQRFGADSAQAAAVARAWEQVGLPVGTSPTPAPAPTPAPTPAPGPAPAPTPAPAPPPTSPAPTGPPLPAQVAVTRSGGVAGLRSERVVEPGQLPAELADEWQQVLGSGVLQQLQHTDEQQSGAVPDGYRYHLVAPESDLDVTVGEHQLPERLRALLSRTFRRAGG